MVSRIQQTIVVAMALAAIFAAATTARDSPPWVAAIVGCTLLTSYVWILAAELVCLWFIEASDRRPKARDLIHAWWGEVLVAALVFFWRQPFRSNALSDRLPAAPDGRRGVLLVHGFACNRGFWTPWMRRLSQSHHPYLALNLEPILGSIEAHAIAIDLAVDRVRRATGVNPVIVAHSMGGLVARHWLQSHAGRDKIHRLITVGTPHRGTWLARFGTSQSGRQMRIGSEWLAALAAQEAENAYEQFTCFYGDCDNVVFPSKGAQLRGADNRRIGRTAHVSLAFKHEVFVETLRWLEPSRAPNLQ